MSTPSLARRSIALALALSLFALGRSVLAADPPEEFEGLKRVEHKKLDHFYVLPAADLAGYKRIRLDPVDVAFDKNWNPNQYERSPSRKITASDMEKIKSTVATEFRKVFAEDLGEAGYKLVDEDGEDVLRVTAAIINLYITAPDKMTAGRSRTYVTSTGHMTLAIALRDSVTGQFLVRAFDSVQARDTGNFMISSSVHNLGDAREAFHRWAEILRKGLDDANARPPST